VQIEAITAHQPQLSAPRQCLLVAEKRAELAVAGVSVRIVGREDDRLLPAGETGLIEVRQRRRQQASRCPHQQAL